MATKVGGQLGLNNPIRQVGTSQSNDVWVSQEQVVEEWGLGEESLWARLVDRQNEILTTGGIACNLWRTLDTGLACTCRKSETSQPNARCQVCYGTGFVGGFEKFGFSTIFIAANTPNLTLSDIIVAQKQPDQFEIAPGKTTGTILTPRFQITRNFKYVKSLIYGFDGMGRGDGTAQFSFEHNGDIFSGRISLGGFTRDFGAKGNNLMPDSTYLSLRHPGGVHVRRWNDFHGASCG